jgi:hypothetical protein
MWFRVVETITRVIFFENQFGSRAGKKIKGLLYRPSPFTLKSGILVRRPEASSSYQVRVAQSPESD